MLFEMINPDAGVDQYPLVLAEERSPHQLLRSSCR
jgi:hypothetical protein